MHATVLQPPTDAPFCRAQNSNLLFLLKKALKANLLQASCYHQLSCLTADWFGMPAHQPTPIKQGICGKILIRVSQQWRRTPAPLPCCNNKMPLATDPLLPLSTHLPQLHLLAHSRQACVQDRVQNASHCKHATHNRTGGCQKLVPSLGQLLHHHLQVSSHSKHKSCYGDIDKV